MVAKIFQAARWWPRYFRQQDGCKIYQAARWLPGYFRQQDGSDSLLIICGNGYGYHIYCGNWKLAAKPYCLLWIHDIWLLNHSIYCRYVAYDYIIAGIELSVDHAEFDRYWRCTLMYPEDIQAIFSVIARAGDVEGDDNAVISSTNIDTFWNENMGEYCHLYS